MQSLILIQGRVSVRLPLSTFNQKVIENDTRPGPNNEHEAFFLCIWMEISKKEAAEFERGESTGMDGFNTCDQSQSAEIQ